MKWFNSKCASVKGQCEISQGQGDNFIERRNTHLRAYPKCNECIGDMEYLEKSL